MKGKTRNAYKNFDHKPCQEETTWKT